MKFAISLLGFINEYKKINIFFIITIILFGFLPNNLTAQVNNVTINPKNNLYLGIEIGRNTITSFYGKEPSVSFQGGCLIEYYYAKHWSVVGRIKYFETGVSYSKQSFNGTYLSSEGIDILFKGSVISIPINLKWEYRIYKNLLGNVKLGLAYNYETESKYNFSENISTDYPKNFGSFNSGIGITYLLNKKTAIYIDYENYLFGGYKGNDKGFIWKTSLNTENNLVNLGMKFNLKK